MTDMSQLRSLLALQQFMRACGEAVEDAEAVSHLAITTERKYFTFYTLVSILMIHILSGILFLHLQKHNLALN